MKRINKCDRVAEMVLGQAAINTDKMYRPLFYTHTVPYEEGMLVYNTLTAELLYLTEEEFSCFKGEVKSGNVTVYELIKKRLLVPVDFNDKKFADEVDALYLNFNMMYTHPKINTFTVLPTTDCNARCFYCFELNGNRRNMSEETAHKTAEYIEKNWNGKSATLRWFGGEPLYNIDAIDIICSDLKAKNINFKSKMISNGYLFDDEVIAKAKALWNLTWVQITLDGTEEIYNRIKAFIYKDEPSAFKRVLGNIEKLLKAGIEVHIRMNMDEHNSDDLRKLTDLLIEKFGEYDIFALYVHLLFEDSCARIQNRDDADRHCLIQKQMELQKYINNTIKQFHYNSYFERRSYHCMADSNTAVMVLPDGNLGKCQHHTDEHFFGNVFSGEIDFEEFNWYKKTLTVAPACEECKYKPMCLFPQCCSSMPHRCDEMDKANRQSMLEKQMINMYNRYIDRTVV